jgi:hypothetical protein
LLYDNRSIGLKQFFRLISPLAIAYWQASLIAASVASDPLDKNNVWWKSGPARSINRFASCWLGSFSNTARLGQQTLFAYSIVASSTRLLP